MEDPICTCFENTLRLLSDEHALPGMDVTRIWAVQSNLMRLGWPPHLDCASLLYPPPPSSRILVHADEANAFRKAILASFNYVAGARSGSHSAFSLARTHVVNAMAILADVLLQDRAAKTLTGLGRDEHSYLIPSFVAQSLGVPSR